MPLRLLYMEVQDLDGLRIGFSEAIGSFSPPFASLISQ